MAYDPFAGGLVLFGGWAPLTVYANGTGVPTSVSNFRNDTWLFRNGTWTNLTEGSAPPANESINGGLAYDPDIGGLAFVGLRLVGSHSGYSLDLWVFVNGAWSERPPPPLPALSGGPGTVVYDTSLSGLVVGPLTPWSPVSSWGTESWYIDRPNGWNVLGLTGNFSPVRSPAAYVPNASAIVGFGAVEQLGPNGQPVPNASYNATWMISAFHFRTVATPSAPSPREDFALTYDPTDDVILLFGGLSPSLDQLDSNNETWELHDLAGTSPPLATVRVAATPGLCSNVVWDRTTSVPNGSQVATSFGLHFLNGPSCANWVFRGWNASGSVTVVENGSALAAVVDVSGDGRIFGWYSPAFTVSVIVLPYLCGPVVRVDGVPAGNGAQVSVIEGSTFGTVAAPCSSLAYVFQGWTFGPGLTPIGNSTGPAVNVSIAMNTTLTAFYGPPPAVSPAGTLGLIVLTVVIVLVAVATVAVLLIARWPRRPELPPPNG